MRMIRLWTMVAVLLAAGCSGVPDAMGPAAPLNDLTELPALDTPAGEAMSGDQAQGDTTGRWGGGLGSGS
jgi:hypothetical protein